MAEIIRFCDSSGCSYVNNGNWANSKQKNPVYVGTNSSGSYEYIAQIIFPAITAGEIKSISLSVYRNSSSASSSKTEYYGCSSDLTSYGSVLATGETVTLSGGEGWKTLDVSAIKDSEAPFAGEWALLLGNPNTKNTYCVIDGYDSGHEPSLTITYDDGSKVIVDGKKLDVLYATDYGTLVYCDLYYAQDENTLVKI